MRIWWKIFCVISGVMAVCSTGVVGAEDGEALTHSDIVGCYVDANGYFWEFKENGKFFGFYPYDLAECTICKYELVEGEENCLELTSEMFENAGGTARVNIWKDEYGFYLDIEDEKMLLIRVDEDEFWNYLELCSEGPIPMKSEDFFQQYAEERMMESSIFDFDKLIGRYTYTLESGNEYWLEIKYASAERMIVDNGDQYWIAKYEDSVFGVDGSVEALYMRLHEWTQIEFRFESDCLVEAYALSEDEIHELCPVDGQY